jgi:predicted dehydrogenase
MVTPAPDAARRLRLAFIGCGAIAHWHLTAVRNAATRTDVTAVVDPDAARAEAMAKETGTVAFASLDEALAEDAFDAALIMVPHRFHEELAIAALRAGKHVLLEKPMAPTLDACGRILAAASTSDTVFAVAENAEHWPEVVLARRLIEDGAIGTVMTARAWHCVPPMEEFHGAGPGGSRWPTPVGVWPSTPARTGCGPCVCGWAR